MDNIEKCKKYKFITKTNFSIIYKYIDDNDGKPYILKVIPKQKIKNELSICNVLPNHPNLIKFVGEKQFENNNCFINNDYQFLVFEYFDGISLHKYIKNKNLSSNSIKLIFYQILNGVNILHKNNIIHNDIKLENILICPKTENIKIIDFGLSQFGREKINETVFGSVPYLAPEILSSKFYSVYSDIWALGILLFAMIEGRFPFYSNSKEDIIDEIMSFNVKGTVKNIYEKKYYKPTTINFFKKIFVDDNTIKSENKILIEISLLCLKSTPEKRPLIEDLLNFNVFQNVALL